jgi:hypothetical protein
VDAGVGGPLTVEGARGELGNTWRGGRGEGGRGSPVGEGSRGHLLSPIKCKYYDVYLQQ